jgi:hypothetical protein
MTAHDELDRRIVDWMSETASIRPPAGRFEQAMESTARRKPRPRWLAAIGSDWVGAAAHPPIVPAWSGLRRELVAAALVALLIAALVGIQALGGAGSSQTKNPAGTPGTPGVPAALPATGDLAPGTYFLANPYTDADPVRDCALGCADYQRLVFTLPAGWATSDGLVHKHLDQPDEAAFSAWTVDQVYADPCHWRGSALGGQPALRIHLSVPADLDVSTCDKEEFRSWSEWDVLDGANSHHVAGQLDTVYMVDVDRKPLVIDASHMPATSSDDLAELDAILASMIIEREGMLDTPSPARTAPLPTAVPADLPTSPVRNGRLEAGTYEYLDVDGAGFNVRFTVPAGWDWDGRYLSKGGVDQPDGAAIFFFGGPVQVYADPCRWAAGQPDPPIGLSVADLMSALAAQPLRGATTPTARPGAVPGQPDRWVGMMVELTVPADIDFASCDGGQFRSWGPEDHARSHQGPGQRDLVWAIDVSGIGVEHDGEPLIVDAASFPGTPADVVSEIEAILGSIATGHWG